jgi:peptide/nickel transport system substrate-binding protein
MLRPALLIMVAGSAALAACGDRTADYSHLPAFCQDVLPQVDAFMATAAESAPAAEGGTVVAGGVGEILGGMNPLLTVDYSASQHQTFVNLMTVVRLDEGFEPRPYLAHTWELSEDGTELTFHLRDDVHWHDGQRTTAYDVEFTYLQASDPQGGYPNQAHWTHYVRGPEGVEVVDSFTVRIELEPHAEYMDPWRAMAIAPRHLLEGVPWDEMANHPYGTRCPVGNGPFRFVEHRAGESWTFARNPAFPEALGGPPELDRYVYRVIPELTTLLSELLTGAVHVFVQPHPDQLPQIERSDQLRVVSFPSRDYVFVAWNSRRAHLADPRVRRALTLATDRAEMVEAILGSHGVVANSGIPPIHWAYDPTSTQLMAHDPDESRRLLDEAGWTDPSGDGIRSNAEGEPLAVTLKYNQGNRQRAEVAGIMQAQLRSVGVAAEIQVLEWATLAGQVTDPSRRDFDGVVLGFSADFRVDDTGLLHSSAVDQPLGFAGIQDDELDRILEELQLTLDRDAALPLWRAYEARVRELQPFTYIYFADRLAGVSQGLDGVRMDARGEWVSIRDWRLAP